jgi:tryptophan synthase alpha chain
MGIQRINNAFRKGHTAFIPYMVMGYPTVDASVNICKALVDCGADIIELGVPFSDPLADGPTIQAAGQQALANGINLGKCIEMAAGLRRIGIETPFLVMTYFNPVLAYGIECCVQDCAKAGIDGFIIPDLPPEESREMEVACSQQDLAIIYLLAPNSPEDRIALVAEKSKEFIYMVSLTGVTGARESLPADLAAFIARVRAKVDLPLAVGFGISNGAQAAAVGKLADGVIVGSALVKKSAQSLDALKELASEIRNALP